ncbi:MAG TPA: prepilin-type cleavage/methylation domain-containing protein, partial [Lysinibacillus sp.]|nr:prepilin-type cleavage/methylation domain-containing protein [Lysinibacillus sp.]
MQKNFKNEGGFSLIEVVASLILITIILLSFFGLFIQSNKTSKT